MLLIIHKLQGSRVCLESTLSHLQRVLQAGRLPNKFILKNHLWHFSLLLQVPDLAGEHPDHMPALPGQVGDPADQ